MEGRGEDVFNPSICFCGRFYGSVSIPLSFILEINLITVVEAIANGVAEVAKYDAGES